MTLKQLEHVNGLVQDCSISIANAVEVLQACTKSSTLICQFMNSQ